MPSLWSLPIVDPGLRWDVPNKLLASVVLNQQEQLCYSLQAVPAILADSHVDCSKTRTPSCRARARVVTSVVALSLVAAGEGGPQPLQASSPGVTESHFHRGRVQSGGVERVRPRPHPVQVQPRGILSANHTKRWLIQRTRTTAARVWSGFSQGTRSARLHPMISKRVVPAGSMVGDSAGHNPINYGRYVRF